MNCGECKNWTGDINNPDSQPCKITGIVCYASAGGKCTIADRKPDPLDGWPDERTMLAAKDPKVGDKWEDSDEFEIIEINNDLITCKRAEGNFTCTKSYWPKYLTIRPVAHLVSRGPEPVTLKDGDVVIGEDTGDPYLVSDSRRTLKITLDEVKKDCYGKPITNLLTLADFFRKNPGGHLVMVPKGKVAPVLTKEEASWLMEIFQAIATSMILKPYKPNDPERTTQLRTAMAKLFAAMGKGEKE